MKKIFLFVIFFSFLGISCQTPMIEDIQQDDNSKEEQVFSIRDENLEEETDYTIVSIVYPQFENQNLSRLAESLILNERKSFEESLEAPFELPGWAEGMKNGFWAEYTVNRYQERIVSLIYTLSLYHAGAAHPNTHYAAIIYDLDTDKSLRFENVFKSDEGSLLELSSLIQKDLQKQFRESAKELGIEDIDSFNSGWIEEGAGPDQNNFSIFILEEESATFLFPPYQVASYAEGTKEVVLLYEELGDLFLL